MEVKIWYSTESMADFIIDHSVLKRHRCIKARLQESDASKPGSFHSVPDHIKQILYLDAPDIIVEVGSNPIFTIEESKEAGTGHNVFQRFSRLVASAENRIPSFYVYPEAVIVQRKSFVKWDIINPLIFLALDRLMTIFRTPALLFFYPSQYPHELKLKNKGLNLNSDRKYLSCPEMNVEMQEMFECINLLVDRVEKDGCSIIESLLAQKCYQKRRDWQLSYYHSHLGRKMMDDMSPLTSVVSVSTTAVETYIKKHAGVHTVGELLLSRPNTILYCVNANFRGDPYPGALTAIDYLKCRNGETFEDRDSNLVMAWGNLQLINGELIITGSPSIEDFCSRLRNIECHNLLNKAYSEIRSRQEIPRYYMQARYGSMFSKSKDIRIYSYFCDAILFKDGVMWREG